MVYKLLQPQCHREDLTRFSPPYACVCSVREASEPCPGEARRGLSSGCARIFSAVGRSAGFGASICASSVRNEVLKVGSSVSLPSRMAWYESPPAGRRKYQQVLGA